MYSPLASVAVLPSNVLSVVVSGEKPHRLNVVPEVFVA
jgi:hypothetical protein